MADAEHFGVTDLVQVHSVAEQLPWSDFYEATSGKALGEGSYGKVITVKGIPGKRDNNTPRAMKTMMKKPKGQSSAAAKETFLRRCREEIDFMRVVDHPSIVRLVECFEDLKFFYLIMEQCSGGELFDRIIQMECFNEAQAGIIVRQVTSAIYYCHSHGICHRDLKPENFLLLHDGDDIMNIPIKIIDFGLACKFEPGSTSLLMKTKAGTPYYVAPEVLAGKYNEKCDTWSIGVLMYVLLCGYPPFYGDDDSQILAMVKKGEYDFPEADWSNVSMQAKQLIGSMLTLDIPTRSTAEQAFHHAWTQSNELSSTSLNVDFIKRLKRFNNSNLLKRMALSIIAHNLQESEIASMKGTFQALDKNGDGVLTIEEIEAGMLNHNIELPENFLATLKQMDSDGSGSIEYTEFLAATLSEAQTRNESACWAAFKVFDIDGDGHITHAELKEVLASGRMDAAGIDIAKMIADNDLDGDGTVDFDEFMSMMRRQQEPAQEPAP